LSRLKQIERKLLPHSATLLRREGGAWEDGAENAKNLQYVRVDGNDRLTYSVDGVSRLCERVLYFDCVNSRPTGTGFRLGDVIVYTEAGVEREYTVKSVFAAPTDQINPAVHHWELGLA